MLKKAACAVLFGLICQTGSQASTFSLNIQPVSKCFDDGGVVSCTSTTFDRDVVSNIWLQAGIELSFSDPFQSIVLPEPANRDNALFDVMFQMRFALTNAGLAPNTVYVGFSSQLDGLSPGTANIGDPFAIAIQEGRTPLALSLLVAHFIGHTLGAGHADDPDVLMSPNLLANNPDVPISQATIDAVLQSDLLVAQLTPVPLPAGLPLFALGLAALGFRCRRKAS
jgi:hypothetical protein